MRTERSDNGLGRRLAGRRLQQGLSQATAARLARIAPGYLSRIETGKAQPTYKTLVRVAHALKAPLERLLADIPRPDAPLHPPCPVTAGGKCLLDLIRDDLVGAGEAYTPAQVRLLRILATYVRRLGPAHVRAIEVALRESAGAGVTGAEATLAGGQSTGSGLTRVTAARRAAVSRKG